MDDILKEFLVESHEHLDRMESDLVALERGPEDAETLARVFRAVHTIKGTCGFFGLPRLEEVTHAGENVLTRLLGGEMRFGPAIADVCLRLVDAVRGILAEIEKSGGEGEPDLATLIDELDLLAAEGAAGPPTEATGPVPEAAPLAPEPEAASGLAAQTVRIDVALLDALMNLVGELVLARNQIRELTAPRQEVPLATAAQQLHRITTDLQEAVMQARMEPIGRVWGKFPRVVRDLAAVFGKKVRIEMRGRQTELDRTVLEAISDPLTHLLRNSLDHGIERPEVRTAAGKPDEGLLVLSAYHQAGYVVIELRDDGAGIDPQKIRREAVERGLLARREAGRLTEQEALELIFTPGFSTATQVTAVSGRGVGMDVVRSNIERVGGAVDLESRPGRGVTVRVKLPLTLAIIPGVVVRVADHRFVIPQTQLRELLRLEGEERDRRIEAVHDAPVCRLRGRLLPLVYLDRVLRLRDDEPPGASPNGGAISIAVLETENRRFGLVVDRILDTQETVVKPLGLPLERIPIYAGATILGDGAIALILDVAGLAARARILGEAADLPEWEDEPAADDEGVRQRYLLFQGPDDGRILVPLEEVTRLEEFAVQGIERTGDRAVVQWGGRILPLVHVSDVLGERRRKPRHPRILDTATEREVLQVAVYTRGEHSIGLIVDRILDVVELAADLQTPGSRAGVRGTAVVAGRVAECIDVERVVQMADPGLLAAEQEE
ncbi:MAG: chemotaxis protein CheW [Planctomycetota bacterium]|jgi:two-component system chemotaxis sensor kinase CheA